MKEIFAKMSAREKIGIAAAAAVVLVVFADKLIIEPMAARMNQLNREIRASEGELRVGLKLLKQEGAVKEEFGKYSAYVKKSGSDGEEQTKMLSEIEELTRKTGVSIRSVKPLAARNEDAYRRYEVEMEIEGEMEPIVNFLYQLNNSPQLLRTEKLTMNPSDRDSPVIKSKLNITKLVMP